jgi:Tfp pilus assembly protein PilO
MSAPASLKSRVLRVDAIGLFACAALAVGAYYAGVEPVINAQARIEEKKQMVDAQLHHAADTEELITREQAKLAALKRQLAATSVHLAPATDINVRLDVISRLVEEKGLAIQVLDPGTAHSDPELGKFIMIPIKLAGTGSFQGVCDFLHELLSKKFPDVEVRSLSLSAPPAPASINGKFESEKAAFSLELRWYAAPAASADAQTSH